MKSGLIFFVFLLLGNKIKRHYNEADNQPAYISCYPVFLFAFVRSRNFQVPFMSLFVGQGVLSPSSCESLCYLVYYEKMLFS